MISIPFSILGIVVLVVLAFFMSLIDVAFGYVSKISIRTYDADDRSKTNFLQGSLEDPMSLLLPLRIGRQGAFIGVAVLVTGLYVYSELRYPLFTAFLTILMLFLVFMEAVPNILARKNPERILIALLPAFFVYAWFVRPISWPLSHLVRAFVSSEKAEDEAATEEEIQAYIEAGEEEGILKGDEGKMVQSIVDFGDKVVREIMTPRPAMVSIRDDATISELRNLFSEEKYSRVPVYREHLDQIVGLVYAIDLVTFANANPGDSLNPLIKDVAFVPETKKVSELLREFQRNNQTLTMVVDEYGGISGLTTVEDILEEIVGEIHDEFDEVDQEIVEETEGVFLVSGCADIDEVKETLSLQVDGSGFETMSGYVLDSIGRIPKTGEVIQHQGIRIEVVEADGQRINKVRISSAPWLKT